MDARRGEADAEADEYDFAYGHPTAKSPLFAYKAKRAKRSYMSMTLSFHIGKVRLIYEHTQLKEEAAVSMDKRYKMN